MPARLAVAVFAGGFAGAVARALLAEAVAADPGTWPWATFAANVAGAFLLAVLVARVPLEDLRWPLLGPGFCGALTTFSTVQLELLRMLDEGRTGLAAGYVAASVAAGLAAVHAGRRVARPPGVAA